MSLIRGVNFTFEIGIALEPQMALLTAVFCADTYVQEIAGKRSETERLYPLKNRLVSVYRRAGIQEMYLLFLAAAGYGLFYTFQKPVPFDGTELFLPYLAAAAVTAVFWGTCSITLSCLFRNAWAGIGSCLLLWLLTDSTMGERMFGKWNVFSYAFRNVEDGGDFGWVCGKFLCTGLSIGMLAVLPKIIDKRG